MGDPLSELVLYFLEKEDWRIDNFSVVAPHDIELIAPNVLNGLIKVADESGLEYRNPSDFIRSEHELAVNKHGVEAWIHKNMPVPDGWALVREPVKECPGQLVLMPGESGAGESAGEVGGGV